MFGHRFGCVLRFIQRDVRHSGACGAIAVRAMGCEPCADAQRNGERDHEHDNRRRTVGSCRVGAMLPLPCDMAHLYPPFGTLLLSLGYRPSQSNTAGRKAMGKRLDKRHKPVNLQSPFTNTTQKSHLVDILLSFVSLSPRCRTRSPAKMAVWRRMDNGVPPTPLTTSGDRPSSVISVISSDTFPGKFRKTDPQATH